jgi:hypothetical protein
VLIPFALKRVVILLQAIQLIAKVHRLGSVTIGLVASVLY